MTRAVLAIVAAALTTACASAPRAPVRDPSLAGLPLVEVPVAAGTTTRRTVAVLLSGDGNWAAYVRGVAETLADSGIAVVGLESRSYLSRVRTPDEVAADVASIARVYLARWHADELVLVGYSRGADFLPFVVNRLPADLRGRVRLVAMLSPATWASFQFHLLDLLHDSRRPGDVATLPELLRMPGGVPVLCAYGREEPHALCPELPPGIATVLPRDGGHHSSDGRTPALAILRGLATAP